MRNSSAMPPLALAQQMKVGKVSMGSWPSLETALSTFEPRFVLSREQAESTARPEIDPAP